MLCPESGLAFRAFAVVGVDFPDGQPPPPALEEPAGMDSGAGRGGGGRARNSMYRVRYLHPKNDQTILLSRRICEFGLPESPRRLFEDKESDASYAAFYTFVLTEEDGSRLYGHCLRVLPLGPGKRHDAMRRRPEVLCFVSRVHHQLFYEALLTVAAYHR
jgi:hypothetical protein